MQIYGCLYEKGRRSSNQDSVALHKIITKEGEAILAAVCDGMGGMEEGETASGYVAEKLSCWFYEELPVLLERGHGQKAIGRSICRKLFHLHLDLKEYGRKKSINAGTTASILLICGRKYMVCHIGDSIVYRLQGNKCRRITGIHGNGISELNCCIGIGKYYQPDLLFGRIRKNTEFILASDGFGHFLKEGEIRDSFCLYSKKDAAWAEKRLKALADQALKRGEQDNISAIYLGNS